MPSPPHNPWLHHPSNIWLRLQIMMLPLYRIFSSPMPNYLPQHLCLHSLSPIASLHVTDQALHPYKTNNKIMIVYIPMFIFLHSKRKEAIFWGRTVAWTSSDPISPSIQPLSMKKVTGKWQLNILPKICSRETCHLETVDEFSVCRNGMFIKPSARLVTFPHAFGWHVSTSTH
jgi:hypothetical protein